ncbi:MAG: hypothetical protein HY894_00125 [Deltaproteobacteria bacterium]|nr:hypothetical protein [Deltaproteobacteria bacterium]
MKTPREKMMKVITGAFASERGFVLILALVSMLAMTIIGISLIINMSTDLQLARNERDGKQAFQLAEAGVNETIARLRLLTTNAKYMGEPSASFGLYRTPGWAGTSFSTAQGAEAANMSAGSTYQATLTYLEETRDTGVYCDDDANSVAAAKNEDTTYPLPQKNCNNEVVMYGQDFGICFSGTVPCTKPSAKKGIYPVYKITSTGTVNGTDRVIEAYVGASDLNMDPGSAINTNTCDDTKNATITGDASAGNTSDVLQGPGLACASCPTPVGGGTCQNKTATDDMTTFLSGDPLSNFASQADVSIKCSNGNTCNADIGVVTDAQWGDCAGGSTSSIIYMDNAGATGAPTKISSSDLPGNCGRGILIVTGDITIGGNVQWQGLIYVMGTLTLDGMGAQNNDILGGIMANSTVSGNSNAITITYSPKTLADVGRQAGSAAKTYISWRRL